MPVAAIVHARTGSARLPGKVLADLAGRPLLAFELERVARARLVDDVVVATSDAPEDDAVAALCDRSGVRCHRGPLDDVAARVLAAAESGGHEAFVRISGDSPLLDPALVDRALELLAAAGADVATNVRPRSFPAGQSVEAIRTEAFRRACDEMEEPADREHVTPFLYRHPERFHIASFTHTPDVSDVRLVVDTAADLAAVRALVAAMDRPHWEYGVDELLDLRQSCAA